MKYLMVSLGGILGANARLMLNEWITRRQESLFPWGTFVINITGSFLLGLYMTLAGRHNWHDQWRLLLAVGFLGAYTTFSTFEFDSLRLLMLGQSGLALRNILGSVLLGLLGVWLGVMVGSARP